MRYAVLGTGMVGQTLGEKLVALGHEVMMGSRTQDNENARAWAERVGESGKTGTFRDAAKFGDVVLNCTQGTASLDVLRLLDRADLAGKVLIDVANPLDFSHGMPPSLAICNTDSLGESIQREFAEARVVKALNTCNCRVMVDPGRVKGEHDVFVCGNDESAKEHVKALLREFGWRSIIDLGNITNARATEQMLPIWLSLSRVYGTYDVNFKIVHN
ncbi:MAG TPA: NAD(P)-binding domain-containing protein [Vicinamibacteria bacterium]|nr:NAD(P)-binding domain-containing protein [Vicinamibacteria bacterium]